MNNKWVGFQHIGSPCSRNSWKSEPKAFGNGRVAEVFDLTIHSYVRYESISRQRVDMEFTFGFYLNFRHIP